MTTSAVIITIVASILSGLAGALISTIIYIKRDKRMFKVQTLKKFAANRYDLLGENFTEALNEIFVVYNDCPEVMDQLNKFHHIVTTSQGTDPANDGLFDYIKLCVMRLILNMATLMILSF